MSDLKITAHFAQVLGAPLHNHRWSWSVLRHDNVLFLRTWDCEETTIRGVRHIMVLRLGRYKDKPGHNERYRHLQLLASGKLSGCFLVSCTKKPGGDPDKPRIADFESEWVWATGRIEHYNGNLYIAAPRRVSVADVRPKGLSA